MNTSGSEKGGREGKRKDLQMVKRSRRKHLRIRRRWLKMRLDKC
jgi:hypothetical protein